MTGLLRRFASDEDGAIFVLFAVMLAVFLGFIALGFDFGRQAATQSELQSYADNVALAAAGELDGNPGAIARARSAAETFITDAQTFAVGSKALGADDFVLTFYRSRGDAAARRDPETTPELARFVHAGINDRQVPGGFARALAAMTGNLRGSEAVSAQAVAGYSVFACNTTPLAFCAPIVDLKADVSNLREGVSLDLTIHTDQLVPGTLSLVNTALPAVDTDGVCNLLSGLSLDLCLLGASGERSSCLSQDRITPAQGNFLPTIKAGLNVRFDIYDDLAAGLKLDPLYAPAANVLSDYAPAGGGQCIGANGFDEDKDRGFPMDDCQEAGSCGAFGDAGWAAGRAEFEAENFGGDNPFPQARTRFAFYNAMVEAQANPQPIAPDTGGGLLGGVLGGVTETVGGLTGLLGLGLPQCAPTASPDPARRVVVAAAIDCSGLSASASTQNAPVLDFYELFVTGPAAMTGNKANFEVIAKLQADVPPVAATDVVVRDVVRLYQ